MPRPRRTPADRRAEGKAHAQRTLAETPGVAKLVVPPGSMWTNVVTGDLSVIPVERTVEVPAQGPVAEPPVMGAGAGLPPMPDRSRLPAYVKSLDLPPRMIRRVLGGLHILVDNPGRRGSHEVMIAEAGSQAVMSRRLKREVDVTHRAAAYCRTCKSMECLGAQYGLAILPLYQSEPVFFEEPHVPA